MKLVIALCVLLSVAFVAQASPISEPETRNIFDDISAALHKLQGKLKEKFDNARQNVLNAFQFLRNADFKGFVKNLLPLINADETISQCKAICHNATNIIFADKLTHAQAMTHDTCENVCEGARAVLEGDKEDVEKRFLRDSLANLKQKFKDARDKFISNFPGNGFGDFNGFIKNLLPLINADETISQCKSICHNATNKIFGDKMTNTQASTHDACEFLCEGARSFLEGKDDSSVEEKRGLKDFLANLKDKAKAARDKFLSTFSKLSLDNFNEFVHNLVPLINAEETEGQCKSTCHNATNIVFADKLSYLQAITHGACEDVCESARAYLDEHGKPAEKRNLKDFLANLKDKAKAARDKFLSAFSKLTLDNFNQFVHNLVPLINAEETEGQCKSTCHNATNTVFGDKLTYLQAITHGACEDVCESARAYLDEHGKPAEKRNLKDFLANLKDKAKAARDKFLSFFSNLTLDNFNQFVHNLVPLINAEETESQCKSICHNATNTVFGDKLSSAQARTHDACEGVCESARAYLEEHGKPAE